MLSGCWLNPSSTLQRDPRGVSGPYNELAYPSWVRPGRSAFLWSRSPKNTSLSPTNPPRRPLNARPQVGVRRGRVIPGQETPGSPDLLRFGTTGPRPDPRRDSLPARTSGSVCGSNIGTPCSRRCWHVATVGPKKLSGPLSLRAAGFVLVFRGTEELLLGAGALPWRKESLHKAK